MEDPLIYLFEAILSEVKDLDVDEFRQLSQDNKLGKFNFYNAVADTPYAIVWAPLSNARATINNEEMPIPLREKALQEIKYRLNEVIAQLKSGSSNVALRRIRPEIVNALSDAKLRQLCLELNNTPDSSVLSLSQLIGETLKWAVWQKAKQNETKLTEKTGLSGLLREANQKGYFSGNVAARFLKDFEANFMKTSFDMVRHSESYVPDISMLNPQIEALEAILAECV